METKLIKVNDDYSIKQNGEYVAFANEDFTGYAPQEFRDNLIGVLSKQNCDGIFGVVDVEKLADDYFKSTNENAVLWRRIDFKEGFNKAMELNKDKVFALEDMRKAISFGQGMDLWKEEEQIDKFIQSLQQPTEIDVEIEMECLDPNCDGIDKKGVCIPGDKPKLDSEGCLILKKI